jgi:predicted nucleic acid-binding protein
MRESEKSNTARLLAKSLRLDIVGIMMVLTRVVEGTLLAAARRKCGISGGSK